MDNMTKINGSAERLEIKCPKCGEMSNITVAKDKEGYFKVVECKKCGYKSSK